MASIFNTGKSAKRKNIFISYRVHDTAGETGRLVDTLKASFFEDQIFMDIEKLEPGVDYAEVISKSLGQCDIMLAVIGPEWKGQVAGSTKSRISQPNDWVRLELSTALQRNITVIPVLVNGGVLPEPEELPEDLQPLLRRQAYEIGNKRWKYDTDQLVQYLVKSGINPKSVEPPKKPDSKMSTGVKILIGGLAMLGLLVVIGLLLPEEKEKSTPNSVDNNAYTNNPQENNNASNENNYPTNSNSTQEPVQQTIEDANIAGSWYESGGQFFMIITQNGKSIIAQSYAVTGAQTGQGTGNIQGDNMTLTMNIFSTGEMLSIKASVSSDGSILAGYVNGTTYNGPIKLEKQL